MQVFAVACSESVGRKAGVVLYAPTMEQAFEATGEVLREQVVSAERPGLASAFCVALHDLLGEGPQEYGWWDDVDGFEVWYGPVTADVPAGVGPGELALLASVTPRRSGSGLRDGAVDRDEDLAGVVAEQGIGVDGGRHGGDGPCVQRQVAEQTRECAGLRAQGRLDGPHLRAGRLGVAVHPHRDGGSRVPAGALAEL
jgi:hypothetical protein